MSGSAELFPVVLARVAGGPLADLQKIEVPLTAAAAAKIFREQKKLAELAAVASDALYAETPKLTDAETRRFWINARRDMHNGRALPDISSDAYAALPAGLQKIVREHRRRQTKLVALQKNMAELYASEINLAKKAFKSLLRQPNFRNGLLLSSTSIYPSLQEYLSDGSSRPAVTKKERSFTEYLSRMYTKPSPFATFTHLAAAEFSDGGPFADDFTTEHHIQLNHELYRYLFGLLARQPDVRRRLLVRPNPTIKKQDGAYHFLVNHENREAFQHIVATPSLDVLYALVSGAGRAVSTYEIARYISAKKYIRASAAEIEAYMDQLIEYGFFELDTGVSGIDREWDAKLAQQLAPLGTHMPWLTDVVDGLVSLRGLAVCYGTAPTAVRQQLLQQAFGTFKKSVCEPLGATFSDAKKPEKSAAKTAGETPDDIFRRTYTADYTFDPHQLWYEDTTLARAPKLPLALQGSLQTLGSLLAKMRQFDGCLAERERLTDFFVAKYGRNATVDLLQLYRDYAVDPKNAEQLTAAQKRREKANHQALELFWKQVKNGASADEVRFDSASVAHLPVASSPASFGAFLHLYGSGRSFRLVLNGTAEGYGKMFSRFLHIFDPAVTGRLRQIWKNPDENTLFAEVTDASFFNANLHPRIMPYEIATPGGHPALPPGAQLSVNDLAVAYDAAAKQVTLLHRPSGKRVVALDLGFQGRRGRSKLYRLLCTFGPGPHHPVYALLDRIDDGVKARTTAGGATVLPRIVYENRIVLRRKAWQIAKDQLPCRGAAESDQEYFSRANLWRHGLGMPDEIFVKGAQRKPQYVSFRNPFLVAVLASVIRGCQELHVEEMLPDSSQLDATAGRAVEFLAQWHMSG